MNALSLSRFHNPTFGRTRDFCTWVFDCIDKKHRNIYSARILRPVAKIKLNPTSKINVILLETVDDIGAQYNVVQVLNDVARLELIPGKQAVYASPANLTYYTALRKQKQLDGSIIYQLSEFAHATIKQLSTLNLSLQMNADHDWVLTEKHVQVALRVHGIILPTSAIVLPAKRPDKSNAYEKFFIKVVINKSKEVPVKCEIFLFSKDQIRLKQLLKERIQKEKDFLLEEETSDE